MRMRLILVAGVLGLLASHAAFAENRQIGQVFQTPVYADQVEGGNDQQRASSLTGLFMAPVLDDWNRGNRDAFKLTDAESDTLAVHIEAYSACSGNGYVLPKAPEWRRLALAMLGGNIKRQKAIHDRYGGGRLLFQQAGVEALDATRRLLEEREAAGDFQITDPSMRALAYDYWTRDHGALLIEDPEEIRSALDIDSAISKCPAT